MAIKRLLSGVAVLPFLASVAMAGQPIVLNDSQMDRITAGAKLIDPFVGVAVVASGQALAPGAQTATNALVLTFSGFRNAGDQGRTVLNAARITGPSIVNPSPSQPRPAVDVLNMGLSSLPVSQKVEMVFP